MAAFAEIFLSSHKPGSPIEAIARDAAVTVSIALQFGAGLETIRGHLAGRGIECAFRGGTMTSHLGIDIGVQGAIAILDQSGALLEIHDMPVLHDGPKGRRAINAPLLASIVFKSHATAAFVEGVGARPGEGAVGAFAFGRAPREASSKALLPPLASLLVFDAVLLEANRRPYARFERCGPRRGNPPLARQCQSFRRIKDDGRAEAALIAVAGLLRKGANPGPLTFSCVASSFASLSSAPRKRASLL